jgi:hypothetical protein
MSYRTHSRDWKKKVLNICPCFVTELAKPEPSGEVCPNPCNLEGLKGLLLRKEAPNRTEIVKTMIKSGVFTKREISYSIVEIHNSVFLSAERRVEEAMAELKKEGFKIWTDDNKNLKARKE